MEILLATLLFIMLSPGLIFTIPPGKGGILSGDSTSNIAVMVHACLFFVAQKLSTSRQWPFDYLNDAVGEITGRRVYDASGNLLIKYPIAALAATILFILLSPGLLITLPPDEGALFMSEDTNTLAVLLHGVIYFIALKGYSWSLEQAVDKDTDALLFDKKGKVIHNSEIVYWFNDQLNYI
jgi:hypothetical protein